VPCLGLYRLQHPIIRAVVAHGVGYALLSCRVSDQPLVVMPAREIIEKRLELWVTIGAIALLVGAGIATYAM
jgi:hypothetical protein